jgi:hypothetical protein
MRYVLDSCVAVKWFLAEPDSAKAIQLLDEFNVEETEVGRIAVADLLPWP